MTAVAQLLSWLALGATIITPLLFFGGRLSLDAMKLWMLVATVAWFVTAPMWMDRAAE